MEPSVTLTTHVSQDKVLFLARLDSTPLHTAEALASAVSLICSLPPRAPGHRHAAVGPGDLYGPRLAKKAAGAEDQGGAGGL